MNPLPVLRFNPSHDSFKEAANISAFLGGRDDEIDIDNNTTKKVARVLWLDILSDSSGDSSSIVTFSRYIDLLQSQSTGFIYEFETDRNDKVNGVVWQTATMRSCFERYGGYIALDAMKMDASYNDLQTPLHTAVAVGRPLLVLMLVPPLCCRGILGLLPMPHTTVRQ